MTDLRAWAEPASCPPKTHAPPPATSLPSLPGVREGPRDGGMWVEGAAYGDLFPAIPTFHLSPTCKDPEALEGGGDTILKAPRSLSYCVAGHPSVAHRCKKSMGSNTRIWGFSVTEVGPQLLRSPVSRGGSGTFLPSSLPGHQGAS